MCDHFNDTEFLRKHLQGLPSPNPTDKALLLLLLSKADPALKAEALQASRSVDVIGSQDPDTMVFIYWWIVIADGPHESIAIARLARSLTVDSSSVSPFAFILANEASAYGYLNDYSGFLASGQEALQVARNARPRIQMRTVAMLACEFALMGYRSRIQEDLDLAWQNNPPADVRDRFLIADLIDATEAFRVDEANRILERLSHGHQASENPASYAASMQEMLHAYVSMFPAQKPDRLYTPFASSSADPRVQEEVARSRTICDHLYQRRSDLALNVVYEVIKSRGEQCFTNPGVDNYFLVRAELANGNISAARRALNVRHDAGLRHPVDAFFRARIALLQKDAESAQVLFRECLSGMDALNARNRLRFELALASEIPAPTLMEWTGFLHDPPVARELPAEPITPQDPIPPLEVGGRPRSNMSQRLIRHVSPGVTRLIGHSRETENVRQFIKRMAYKDVPILITGQTGTGKDVVARAIHEESSRTAHPFMAINCAALGENLLSSELFGHERGAFTGASEKNQGLIRAAGKGALFLDEIGEITPNMQASLLRVLETGEFRPVGGSRILSMECRIIAATNRNLVQEVRDGRFREDLFYRLRRLEIQLSPLSQRKEDIVPLAHFFFNWDRTGSERVRLHADLETALAAHTWPGNVRELRNTIERIRLFHGDKIQYGMVDLLDVLPDWNPQVPSERAVVPMEKPADPLPTTAPNARSFVSPNSASERSPVRLEEAVLHLFKKYGKLTRKELMVELQVAPNTATHYLNRLIIKGHIEKVMPSPSPRSHYFQWVEKPKGTSKTSDFGATVE